MSKLLIQLDTDLSASSLTSVIDLSTKGLVSLQSIENYMGGISGGAFNAAVSTVANAVSASATMTVTSSGSAAAQTCSIANVTLTAVASDPAANQFVVSSTPSVQAANMAAAINASASLAGIVSAKAVGAVVTITSLLPGKASNGLQISAGTLVNVAVAQFANGSGSFASIYSSK